MTKTVQIKINGKSVAAELEADGTHVLAPYNGQTLRLPVNGRYSLKLITDKLTGRVKRTEAVSTPAVERRTIDFTPPMPKRVPEAQLPQVRRAAAQQVSKQREEFAVKHAVNEARAKFRDLPLSERITANDAEALMELMFRTVLESPEHREGMRTALDMADALEAASTLSELNPQFDTEDVFEFQV